jgi:hypothetical protein
MVASWKTDQEVKNRVHRKNIWKHK